MFSTIVVYIEKGPSVYHTVVITFLGRTANSRCHAICPSKGDGLENVDYIFVD